MNKLGWYKTAMVLDWFIDEKGDTRRKDGLVNYFKFEYGHLEIVDYHHKDNNKVEEIVKAVYENNYKIYNIACHNDYMLVDKVHKINYENYKDMLELCYGKCAKMILEKVKTV